MADSRQDLIVEVTPTHACPNPPRPCQSRRTSRRASRGRVTRARGLVGEVVPPLHTSIAVWVAGTVVGVAPAEPRPRTKLHPMSHSVILVTLVLS